VARRARLDAELVRRGLARSREQAAELIASGRVLVGGQTASKPATGVDAATPVLVVEDSGPSYASRGGHKLAGALDAFGYDPAGKRVLDAGASTGGFTDVLLQRGAAHVVAVDVGYGQLAWKLRTDPRVRVHERTNVRTMAPGTLQPPASLAVMDASFISLRLLLEPTAAQLTRPADVVALVKPQFEVGRGRLGPGGVVRDAEVRAEAVRQVAAAAAEIDLVFARACESPLPGAKKGNVEIFAHFRRA